MAQNRNIGFSHQSHGLIPLYHSASFYFKELMFIIQIVAVFFMKVLLSFKVTKRFPNKHYYVNGVFCPKSV